MDKLVIPMDKFAFRLGRHVCDFLISADAQYLANQACGSFGENAIAFGYGVVIGAAVIVLVGLSRPFRRN